jgi:hypothetical protein
MPRKMRPDVRLSAAKILFKLKISAWASGSVSVPTGLRSGISGVSGWIAGDKGLLLRWYMGCSFQLGIWDLGV